ncbi:stress-responsive transcription factor hsf1 [Haplosporangium sp. Z 27]|nr:stress-responsive transcription factor hsf1 [Haplosporangium sp. Z 27]
MFNSGNGDATNAGNPRIVELSSNSPLTTTLDNLQSVNNNNSTTDASHPIITTPESGSLSYMPSPVTTNMMAPVNMSSLALINPSKQQQQLQQQLQQQKTSEAALALLSSIGSSNTPALPQGGNSSGRNGGKSRSTANRNSAAGSAGTPVPLASNLQTLQPLNRPPNGVRGNVAAFLSKLYNMVGDEGSNDLIRWSDDGQSFLGYFGLVLTAVKSQILVMDHVEFAKEVLPKFFKHNNFSSFVRQLNMYGFHKVPHLQQGVLMPDSDSEQWEFSNPNFQKNQPDLLYLVARKKATGPNEDKDALTMDLGHILQDVAAIKRHQVAISTELKNIERDHKSLWQESIAARDRHQRQQETIDKILRFLASVFSGDKKRAIVPNKKARLTITDGEGTTDDAMRLMEEEEEEEEHEDEDEEEDIQKPAQSGAKRKRSSNDSGPDVTVDGVLNNSKPLLNISEITPAALTMLANAKSAGNAKNTQTPTVKASNKATLPTPTVSAAAPNNFNLPDYLSSFPGLNFTSSNNPAGFKFDPSNLTIPTTLLPNALSPVHHDMLQQISLANARDTNTHSNAPPLPPLPPSLTQTPSGANVTKGVDQITQEIEQLQRSIQDLSQHQLIGDHFDFDDDAFMPLSDHYDPNSLGDLGDIYNDYSNSAVPTSTSAVPSTSPTSNSVGANPRISTVGEDYLEDLLNLDPV